ncbi:MAG: hypothetical protein KBD21_04640 [Candidatus Pacebacteria bacterium]|nr:hypothetical protein [Candidatus Paceibacterota bacterium]
MNNTKSIFLSITLTTLIVGSVSYYFFYEDCQVDLVDFKPATLLDDRPSDEVVMPVDNVSAQPLATGTLSYYIPEMGIRFEYPAYATVTVNILEGTTGELLSGSVRLSQNTSVPYEGKSISFSGMTEDFSWPKGCDGGCTTGYSKIEGIYHYNRSTREGSILNVSHTLTTNDGTEAIILTEDEDLPSNTVIEAIINTNNSRFPGVSFRGGAKTPEDRALFESIIRSIEVE